ncbi:MAG: serine dehydratase subunit alpha family protein [Thermodesulfobacteriota bacterium]
MDLESFFRHEVKPALGCTEPGAVAYAASVAARLLDGPPRHIHLRLSSNVFKNGASVGIPGTGGLKGNLLAAALGALGGDPEKGLQSLETLTCDVIAGARAMLEGGQVTQEIVPEVPSVYVEVEMLRQGGSVTAIVSHRHDNVVEVRRNGRTVQSSEEGESGSGVPAYLRDLSRLGFAQLWDLASEVDEPIREFMLRGARMNMAVAAEGVAKPWGLGVGYGLNRLFGAEGLGSRVKAWAAAGADVRMAGGDMAVMSSAGSGNHGLTAIIPLALAAREWGSPDGVLAESLALSHLVTGAIKAKTGRLTPVCGCTVAAGSGAAAGLTRLAGGTPGQAEGAAGYVMAALTGMICDGAKASCALKVATAASEAYSAAMLSMNAPAITGQEGIIGPDFSANTASVGELCSMGFAAVDSAILRIMRKASDF